MSKEIVKAENATPGKIEDTRKRILRLRDLNRLNKFRQVNADELKQEQEIIEMMFKTS